MRHIFIVLVFLIALIAEVSVSSRIGFLGLYPNIFLMFLVASFFILPEVWVFNMTFLGLLVVGLFVPISWGLLILPAFLIYIILYLLHKYIFTNINFLVIFLMSIVATIFYNFSLAFFYFLWGQRIDIVFFLKTSLVFNLIINGFLAAMWYYLIKSVWENFLKKESYSRLLR
jgi:hypothetical protein